MRSVRFLAVSAIAVTTLALTGCTSPAPDLGGSTVESVSVSGGFNMLPTVEMPAPLAAEHTECRVVTPGTGEVLQDGQLAQLELSIYNGSTGKLIQQTQYDGSNPQGVTVSDNLLPGLRQGLKCASDQSRIVMVIPPADAFKEAGNPDWGIGANDDLVIVADVTHAYLARANGTPQLSQDGMPMVVLAPNGQPGVTVPKTAPPSTERVSVLLKGSGPVVQSGDLVTIHYTGLLWDAGTVFDSSWKSGKPARFVVGDGVSQQGDVIQGFSNALIGQTVGSQVLAVIPPDLGYGAQGAGSIPANATLVFVVDILGVN